MDKSENTEVIKIESDSRKSQYYSVNIKLLTCNCPHFYKKLRGLPLDDPHRLCKHLVKALTIKNIPEHLKQYKEDIDWFAQHKSAFTDREKALKNKKWDKNLPLPEGNIRTITSSKKKKYCYVEGIGDEKKILATLPLAGGVVHYHITNFGGSYDLTTQASHIPWNYRYMEQAVINWIVDEYNKVKNPNAPTAKNKKILEYKLNPEPIPEGGISTISIKKYDASSEILESPFDAVYIPEDDEYYHVIGEANKLQIDALILVQSTLFYYSINGSRIYSFDMNPLSDESEIELPDIETASPMKLVITCDLSDKFPRSYQFMEKAVIKWLNDEYLKLMNK